VIAILIAMLAIFCCHRSSRPRGPYCLPSKPFAASVAPGRLARAAAGVNSPRGQPGRPRYSRTINL
jgi:hypothetical protein